MAAVTFSTANQTFRQLFGNGLTYRVPPFQRDYSWGQDEWDDLWQDIQETLRPGGESAHYLGYVVLQTADNRSFDIIDGQQRLTTISLLILATLKAIQGLAEKGVDTQNNQRRLEQLRNSYIGYLDPVTLIPRVKLALNRNNDGYYRDYLVPLGALPQRNLRVSEQLLRRAYQWFERKVQEAYGNAGDGGILAQFVESLSDKLFFTVITVTDELNAFKVFETLNARGVRLSPTDLLKNYLFSVVHRESSHAHEIETLERRWEALVGTLGGESFPDFLRTHWNSRHAFVRESGLFKTVRAHTPNKERAFALLREMEQDAGVYVALANAEDSLWTPEQRRLIRELVMYGVRQPWPLLLAVHRHFDEAGFTRILRACSVISFRYNVIANRLTSDQERTYNDVVQRIAGGELAQPSDVIAALAPVYLPDDQFRTAFADKSLRTLNTRNRRIVRYILFKLEQHLSGQEFDFESPRYTLEHVLPENPETNWSQFTDQQIEAFAYRLGNCTLLEGTPNHAAGNAAYEQKRQDYAASVFQITRDIAADNDEWTVERLANRQRRMAHQVTSIWRVGQL